MTSTVPVPPKKSHDDSLAAGQGNAPHQPTSLPTEDQLEQETLPPPDAEPVPYNEPPKDPKQAKPQPATQDLFSKSQMVLNTARRQQQQLSDLSGLDKKHSVQVSSQQQ